MIRIATVGYLNAAPLVAGLDHDRYAVSADIPARVAQALRSGQADVALTPVVSALNDGNFRIVGGVAIGSEGPVHSVVLVAETEPEEWTEIVLDGESRTSAILTQVLLRGPLQARCSASVRTVEPGEGVELARGQTAALVIGDAAMTLPDRLTVRLDLGEIWTEWTGLPLSLPFGPDDLIFQGVFEKTCVPAQRLVWLRLKIATRAQSFTIFSTTFDTFSMTVP